MQIASNSAGREAVDKGRIWRKGGGGLSQEDRKAGGGRGRSGLAPEQRKARRAAGRGWRHSKEKLEEGRVKAGVRAKK